MLKYAFYSTLFFLSLASSSFALQIQAPAPFIQYDQVHNAIILSSETYVGEFKDFVELWDRLVLKPDKVFMDGPGGSFSEAVDIGLFIHDNGLDTYAGKSCMSSCAYMFLAGKHKYEIWASEIGLHPPYDPSNDIADSFSFGALGWYFGEIGVPLRIMGDISENYKEHGIDLYSAEKYFLPPDQISNENQYDYIPVSLYDPKMFEKFEMPFLDVYNQQDHDK